MRIQKSAIVALLTPWTVAIAVLCALDPDSIMQGLTQAAPNLAAPAAALGLTLITAANQDRR